MRREFDRGVFTDFEGETIFTRMEIDPVKRFFDS